MGCAGCDMIQMIDKWLTPSSKIQALVDPVFRLLTSLIFIVGGLGHFGQQQQMLDRMSESPWNGLIVSIGDPALLLELSGLVFVSAGLALAIGWMTRMSALLLLVTLVPITVTIHFVPGHVGPLLKNIAIMGALVLIWARGPGVYALDNRQRKLVD